MTDHGPAMSPEEFKRNGEAVLDWIADYRADEDGHRPVQSNIDPGSIYEALANRRLHPCTPNRSSRSCRTSIECFVLD